MKKLLLLAVWLPLLALSAQQPADIVGDWEGSLALPGMQLKMQLNLTLDEGDNLAIAVDVPQQGINAMEATEVAFKKGALSFKLPGVPGNAGWSGNFKAAPDANALDSLVGNWEQGGRSMPLSFARPSGPLAGPALAANLTQIETYAAELVNRMKVPGAGIAIVHKDEVVKSFGVGYADLEAKRAATGSTVFAIGSSTKAFTAFGLGLLADEGKLEWDEPVIEYLPDFRMYDDFATQEMTAIDLLTHRSGLPRHDLLWYLDNDISRQELYQRLRYLEPTASFRSTFQYQNLMYMTAGILTEKLSGQAWETYIKERVFDPLGMASANFDVTSLPDLADFAYGYRETEEESLEKMDYHPLPAIGPAGSINASAADMGKWVSLHLTGGKVGDQQLIESGTLNQLHEARITLPGGGRGGVSHQQYALGWFVYDWNGHYVVEHGGNIDGFSALVYLAPEEDLGFVILTNKNGTAYGNYLARYALNLLTGNTAEDFYTADQGEEEEEDTDEDDEEEEDSRFPNTEPQHALSDYVGKYLDPGYGEIVITETDGQLMMAYADIFGPMEHHHFETFRANIEKPDIEIDVNFLTDIGGKVRALEVTVEPSIEPVQFEKQADDNMKDPAYLDQLAGNYELNGQTLVIKRVRDHLTLDVPGQPTYKLEADSDNEFKLTVAAGYSAEFIFKKKKVVAMVLHQPNGDFRAERVK